LYTFGWGGRYQKSIPFGMGCLGNGSTSDVLTPTKIDVQGKKLKAISMGKRHAVSITEDGEVFSWGKGKPIRI
jgi:alpha-tubulin suppressor-like RCC1 family protein